MAPGTTLEVRGNQEGENTALKQGRIQFIAADQDKLLAELDGYEVNGPKATTLETSEVEIDDQGMTVPYEILDVLVDPNVAFLLLLIGLLGLALEVLSPGTIIPGAIGTVALILGIIGAIHLPVAALRRPAPARRDRDDRRRGPPADRGHTRGAGGRRPDRRRPDDLRHRHRPDRGQSRRW